jgi:hypothetical protein
VQAALRLRNEDKSKDPDLAISAGFYAKSLQIPKWISLQKIVLWGGAVALALRTVR